eukprot:4882919-Pyramimonas_sp.AAC.1
MLRASSLCIPARPLRALYSCTTTKSVLPKSTVSRLSRGQSEPLQPARSVTLHASPARERGRRHLERRLPDLH